MPAPSDQFGGAVAVSGNLVAVGARVADVSAMNSGTVFVFDLTAVTPEVPVHTMYDPAPASGEQFGHALAIDGQILVVGAWLDAFNGLGAAGGAFVYDLSGDTPTTVSVTLQDPQPSAGDQFGYAVSVFENTLVVGARLDNFGTGAAFIYELTSATPATSVAALENTTPASGDRFGYAIDMNETFMLISSPQDDDRATNAGKVLVYDISTGSPQETMSLYKPDAQAGDVFGAAVALSGSRAAIAATRDDPGATDAGSVYIFDLAGTTPDVPEFVLHNPEPGFGEQFGYSLAISGDLVAVGVPLDAADGANSGTTYVYDLSSASPTAPIAVLRNPTPAVDNVFGWSVDVNGSMIAVGAPLHDSDGINAGRTYLFDMAGPNPQAPFATLSPLFPTGDDGSGFDVALSDNHLVVGSLLGDFGIGTALVYDLAHIGTNQPIYSLNRPMPNVEDVFGFSVAIHDDRVIVGELYNEVNAVIAGARLCV